MPSKKKKERNLFLLIIVKVKAPNAFQRNTARKFADTASSLTLDSKKLVITNRKLELLGDETPIEKNFEVHHDIIFKLERKFTSYNFSFWRAWFSFATMTVFGDDQSLTITKQNFIASITLL